MRVRIVYCVAALFCGVAARADDKLPSTITVGGVTYSNVTWGAADSVVVGIRCDVWYDGLTARG